MISFQRNASFVAFMLVVVTCCFLLVVGKLRGVIQPLIWASFFALPLQRAVVVLNDLEINCVSSILRLFTGTRHPSLPVPFWHMPGRKFVRVESTEPTLWMLEKVLNPLAGCPCHRRQTGSVPVVPNRVTSAFTACCRRRLRIKNMESIAAIETLEPNGLMSGGNYHLTAIHVSAEGDGLNLEFSVDGNAKYPALFEEEDSQQEVMGTLEMDKTSAFSWMLAIFIVIILVLLGVACFASLIFLGTHNLMDNLTSYQLGVKEFFDWIGGLINDDEQWKSIQKAVNDFIETAIPALAEVALGSISGFLVQALFMVIYLLFWLTEPIPVASSVTDVFKSYLLLKTCVCVLFASCMSLLLWCLNVKIWPLFFILSFLLNYIPEIGALLCGILSVFVVLFDGSTQPPSQRAYNTLILMVIFGVIKVVTANVIEMRMYANRGGEFMRMHPVVLLAIIFLGDVLLGISGMFLSVPIMAAVKYYLVSADMPRTFLDPLLVFIEGNEMAPHMNAVDRRRAAEKDNETELRNHSSIVEAQAEAQAEARSPLLPSSNVSLQAPAAAIPRG